MTAEQCDKANKFTPAVVTFGWSKYTEGNETLDQAQQNHFNKLKKEHADKDPNHIWDTGSQGRCWPSRETVFVRWIWRTHPKELASIPYSMRPFVFQSKANQKNNYECASRYCKHNKGTNAPSVLKHVKELKTKWWPIT
jgi:hypothetical protein